MCYHTACGRTPEIVLHCWDPQTTQRSGSPPKESRSSKSVSPELMQLGPTSSGYLPRLEANATARRIRLRCFESGNGDRRGRRTGWGPPQPGHNSRRRGVRCHQIARSSSSTSLARASLRRGPVDRYRRDEGLSALILRGRATLPQYRDAGDLNLCRLRYNRLTTLTGLTTPDYTLSWPSEPAGYIIYDGCKCNI